MKKLASLVLAGCLVFANAEGLFVKKVDEVKKEINQINLPFIFKTTTEDSIKNVAISHDDKKITVATAHKIKIFDTKEEELIKTLHFSDLIEKVKFSKDNKKIFILTNKKFYIYDANKYNELAHINMLNKDSHGDEYFVNFFIRGNFLGIIEQFDSSNDGYKQRYYGDNSTIIILNLKNREKINSFRIDDLIYNGDFSPNLKKIALTSNSKNYTPIPYIYNLDGELLHKLPKLGKYYHIKWLNNKDVVVESINRAYIFNIKNSKRVATIKTENNIAGFRILDNKHIATFIYNYKMKIFDIDKNDFLNKEYLFKGESGNDAMNNFDLSDDKKFLAVAYKSKNMKFYKTSDVFKNFITEISNSSNNSISKETTQEIQNNISEKETSSKVVEQKPKVIIKKEIVEKVVVKKVKEHENKKPTLTIYASQTEGEAPLTVNFKFVANDEDGKIAFYYVNFAGQEIMHKGNPTKSFNYTFKNAGKYKIMVAVKDNKGAITTKQVTINVKPKHEENFEDYKRSLMGQ
jgi:hypothetical protein